VAGLEHLRRKESRMRVFPGLQAYLVLAVFLLIDFVWLAFGGFGIHWDSVVPGAVLMAVVGLPALCLRLLSAGPGKGIIFRRETVVRAGLSERVMFAGEAFLFLLLGWNVMRLFNHLSMTTGFPMADALLTQWDAALGLDWNAYFAFVAERPELIELLGWSYLWLTPVSAGALLGLLAMDRQRSAEFFVVAFFATAAVCTVAGMFFPAEAATAYLLDRPELLAAFSIEPGLYHLDHLHALRAGGPLVFDLNSLPGLVTFPSFHTAAGVVMAWAYRRSLLFWPVLVYALLMIASTPIFGGHYFIDLIAGTIVAVAILVLLERRPRYLGLFTRAGSTASDAVLT
jgi:membrane-associated phospholipid phosphatase